MYTSCAVSRQRKKAHSAADDMCSTGCYLLQYSRMVSVMLGGNYQSRPVIVL